MSFRSHSEITTLPKGGFKRSDPTVIQSLEDNFDKQQASWTYNKCSAREIYIYIYIGQVENTPVCCSHNHVYWFHKFSHNKLLCAGSQALFCSKIATKELTCTQQNVNSMSYSGTIFFSVLQGPQHRKDILCANALKIFAGK